MNFSPIRDFFIELSWHLCARAKVKGHIELTVEQTRPRRPGQIGSAFSNLVVPTLTSD